MRRDVCAQLLTYCMFRDFLLFMPHDKASLRTIYSYYLSTVNVNPEGDVNVSDELNLQGLGTTFKFPFVVSVDPLQTFTEAMDMAAEYSYTVVDRPWMPGLGITATVDHLWSPSLDFLASWIPSWCTSGLLTQIPGVGYFLAGGVAGALSRTATAPLDRLKVYMIAQTGKSAVDAVGKGQPVVAAATAARPLANAIAHVWRSGGIRAFFAGEKIRGMA